MTNRKRASSSGATEQATPERQREARQRGEVAVSADLSAAVALGTALAVFVAGAPAAVTRLLQFLRVSLGSAASTAGGGSPAVFAAAGEAALAVALPLVVIPGAAVLAVTLLFGAAQTGGLFSLAIVRPDVARSSGIAGMRRLLGAATAIEVARASVKVALVVTVAVSALLPLVRALPELAHAAPATILEDMGVLALRLTARVVVALFAWGIVDWALGRWRRQRELAMTRDEVRRERREREGDPRQRAEYRRLHREATEQPWPGDARGADLVVAGRGADGADLAVAIVYDRSSGRAPVVLVAGRGAMAGRIRQAFLSAHGGAGAGGGSRDPVTLATIRAVHLDDALAAALIDVPAGQEIPESCFEWVAALLRPLVSPSGRLEGPVAAP